MEQTKALNALAPFLALSKSATSPRAAADLVTQATSAPNTYVFAELLQTPNIQKLRDSQDHAPQLHLLEIFAWGTWADYQAHSTTLPELNPQQHRKLLLLSLLPLSHTHTTLSYAALLSVLSLPSPVALSELLTSAIYAGLLTATLDPAKQVVHVTSVAPLRDLAPGSVQGMVNVLGQWEGRCNEAVRELEERVREVKQGAVRREKGRRKREAVMDVLLQAGGNGGAEDAKSGGGGGTAGVGGAGGGGGGGAAKRGVNEDEDEDYMDVDQESGGAAGAAAGGRVTRGQKRGPGGAGSGGFSGLGGLGRRLG